MYKTQSKSKSPKGTRITRQIIPAEGWNAILSPSKGNVEKFKPLAAWALVEDSAGHTEFVGLDSAGQPYDEYSSFIAYGHLKELGSRPIWPMWYEAD